MKNTIQQLAAETSAKFVTDKRDDGAEFVKVRDDEKAEWITDMIREAHGDMMPDDWKYQFIVDALDLVAEAAGDDTDDAIKNGRDGIEASIYTHDLLRWLSSNLNRVAYVDEAVQEYGYDGGTGIVGAIMTGQHAERSEVFESVTNSLRAKLDETEEE